MQNLRFAGLPKVPVDLETEWRSGFSLFRTFLCMYIVKTFKNKLSLIKNYVLTNYVLTNKIGKFKKKVFYQKNLRLNIVLFSQSNNKIQDY